MKKLFAIALIAMVLMTLGISFASANAGPHGGYTATTDECAGCHRAHTAAADNLLINTGGTTAVCMACHAAAECAAAIMAVGNYDAEDTHQETHEVFHVKLRLHCGLACGKITFFHLGNADRTEAIMGGDPIPQLAKCEAQAEQGQVVMSPEFFTLLPQDSLAAKTSTHAGKNYLLHWERMTQAPAQASKSGYALHQEAGYMVAAFLLATVEVSPCNAGRTIYGIFCDMVSTEKEQRMSRRKRRNHSSAFKAKVALAALKGLSQ